MNNMLSKHTCNLKKLNLTVFPDYVYKPITKNIQTAAPLTKLQIKKYCDVLGVPVNSTALKVKDAFYDRSFAVHPDRNSSKNSERLFTELHEAYKALMLQKKNYSEDDAVKWNKADKNHVRPWFRSAPKTRKNSPPTNNYQTATPAQQNINIRVFQDAERNYTYSSAWCEKYYTDLMQKQFLEKKKKMKESEPKKNECVVM